MSNYGILPFSGSYVDEESQILSKRFYRQSSTPIKFVIGLVSCVALVFVGYLAVAHSSSFDIQPQNAVDASSLKEVESVDRITNNDKQTEPQPPTQQQQQLPPPSASPIAAEHEPTEDEIISEYTKHKAEEEKELETQYEEFAKQYDEANKQYLQQKKEGKDEMDKQYQELVKKHEEQKVLRKKQERESIVEQRKLEDEASDQYDEAKVQYKQQKAAQKAEEKKTISYFFKRTTKEV